MFILLVGQRGLRSTFEYTCTKANSIGQSNAELLLIYLYCNTILASPSQVQLRTVPYRFPSITSSTSTSTTPHRKGLYRGCYMFHFKEKDRESVPAGWLYIYSSTVHCQPEDYRVGSIDADCQLC